MYYIGLLLLYIIIVCALRTEQNIHLLIIVMHVTGMHFHRWRMDRIRLGVTYNLKF